MKHLRLPCFAMLALVASVAFATTEKRNDDDVEAGTIGTGIVGEIAALSDFNVNGVRIDLSGDPAVVSALGARALDTLEIGETVAVEARWTGSAYEAQSIRIQHAIIAPVERVTQGSVTVLGLTLDTTDLPSVDLAAGQWVAVSGFWRGDRLMASHLRPVADREEVKVAGSFSERADGAARVGPFVLMPAPDADIAVGDYVVASGSWSPATGAIMAREVQRGLLSDKVQTQIVQGFISQPDDFGRYYVYGSGNTFLTSDLTMRFPEDRSLFCISGGDPMRFTQEVLPDLTRSERIRFFEARARDTSTTSGVCQ